MEHFVVSARKYRPQTFKDVVGQQAITNTLLNAIEHNHLAQALLFTGPRGVGKTTCARILAKMINHDGNQNPDEDFAFNIFELDAASNNSVDDIRNLIDQVRIPPQVGKYKVYIIDEVHMLSASAFNAFLKTLEEPPKHAIFILATTEKHKIIPTILSRCQIFDFKRITVKDARQYLGYIAEQQGIDAEEEALHIIAQKADGAMRDALSIYDRVVSFTGAKLTRQAVTENLNVLDYETYLNITQLILDNNIPELLVDFNTILSHGFDGHHFVSGLASHFRDLLVCKDQRTIDLLEVGETAKANYFKQSQQTSHSFLLKGIEMANDCDLKYKASRNQRLLVELCLMQLASINFDGEKKKSEPFIISPEHFKNTKVAPVSIPTEAKKVISENEYSENVEATTSSAIIPSEENRDSRKSFDASIKNTELQETKIESSSEKTNLEKSSTKEIAPKESSQPEVNPTSEQAMPKKVSGLSIKSIKQKKEILAKKHGEKAPASEVLDEAINEPQLHAAWDEYIHRLKNKGEKILASIMETDMPKLTDKVISIELPADTMKNELERHTHPLMSFLKKKLQNTLITLDIKVNEQVAKKYAFTDMEKFNKLKEQNPLLEKLRKTFDLDI
ncbi:DNA polymerase-3 subunit gamma/tau [Gillisia mitskevichiae]|uniref:DNA polymerase III subunit gamma/tau n=1 Tax=Gillisia mitskevichiae TaxID=270921 RepID=A0A495PQK7_9FLAO|nr:DNA polymerase III subunit gamma/tau [Gillisia mitskevichiae]RKS52924.1 DNA polymerase-3 subunit gamma/tau [Gillisia mitskevichiae]